MKKYLILVLIFLCQPSFSLPFLSIRNVDYETNFPKAVISLHVNGNPSLIRGLTEDNFSLYEDDYKASFINVKALSSDEKVYVVLAIDNSKSLSNEQLERNKKHASSVINKLNASTFMALSLFNDDVKFDALFSDSRDELLGLVKNYKRSGSFTSLYNCIYDSLDFLSKTKNSRKALLIWTDGKDEGSSVTFSDIAFIAKKQQIPLVFITSKFSKNVKELQRLSKMSGGETLFIENKDCIDSCSDYIDMVKRGYEISYTSGLPKDGKTHKIEIKLKSGNIRDRSEIEIKTSKGIFQFFNLGFLISILILIIISLLVLILYVLVQNIYIKEKSKDTSNFKNKENKWYYKKNNETEKLDKEITEEKSFQKNEKTNESEDENIAKKTDLTKNKNYNNERVETSSINEKEQLICRAWVFCKEGCDKGIKKEIKTIECFLGKDKKCDIRVRDENVNEHHAKIKYINGNFYLYDLVSDWGTFLNGKKLLRPRKLYDWDEIQIGTTVYVFRKIMIPSS